VQDFSKAVPNIFHEYILKLAICCVAELQFPSDANVFYAMDTTSPNSTFLVKKTSERTPKKMFKTKSFS